MNCWLSLEAKSPEEWKALLPKVMFYQEETILRLDHATTKLEDDTGQTGVTVKCPMNESVRLFEIFTKAGLIGPLKFTVEQILPQDDPDETKILKGLYVGGDTSEAPPDTVPREVETDSARFYMTKAEYAEYMKGSKRRAT